MEFFSTKESTAGKTSSIKALPPPKKVLSVAFFSATVLQIAFLSVLPWKLLSAIQKAPETSCSYTSDAFGKEALAAQEQMTLERSSEEAEAVGPPEHTRGPGK